MVPRPEPSHLGLFCPIKSACCRVRVPCLPASYSRAYRRKRLDRRALARGPAIGRALADFGGRFDPAERRTAAEQSDHWKRTLACPRRERPCRRAAKQTEEIASFQVEHGHSSVKPCGGAGDGNRPALQVPANAATGARLAAGALPVLLHGPHHNRLGAAGGDGFHRFNV